MLTEHQLDQVVLACGVTDLRISVTPQARYTRSTRRSLSIELTHEPHRAGTQGRTLAILLRRPRRSGFERTAKREVMRSSMGTTATHGCPVERNGIALDGDDEVFASSISSSEYSLVADRTNFLNPFRYSDNSSHDRTITPSVPFAS
jgi:hypothetical protein